MVLIGNRIVFEQLPDSAAPNYCRRNPTDFSLRSADPVHNVYKKRRADAARLTLVDLVGSKIRPVLVHKNSS